MSSHFQFNRMELAGSLGDFGTILPLALTLLDMKTRKDLFIPLIIIGITLASNLAADFATGIVPAYGLKSKQLTV
jgi:hypothetical protein